MRPSMLLFKKKGIVAIIQRARGKILFSEFIKWNGNILILSEKYPWTILKCFPTAKNSAVFIVMKTERTLKVGT